MYSISIYSSYYWQIWIVQLLYEQEVFFGQICHRKDTLIKGAPNSCCRRQESNSHHRYQPVWHHADREKISLNPIFYSLTKYIMRDRYCELKFFVSTILRTILDGNRNGLDWKNHLLESKYKLTHYQWYFDKDSALLLSKYLQKLEKSFKSIGRTSGLRSVLMKNVLCLKFVLKK